MKGGNIMGYLLPIQRVNPLATRVNDKKRNLEKVKGPFPIVLQTKYEEKNPWRHKNRFEDIKENNKRNELIKKEDSNGIKELENHNLPLIVDEEKGYFIHEFV